MESIQVRDKTFEISISAKEIDAAVERMAKQINKDFAGKNPLFLVVLNYHYLRTWTMRNLNAKFFKCFTCAGNLEKLNLLYCT